MKHWCKHAVVALIGLCGVSNSSYAATQENNFSARGLGGQPCKLLVSSLNGPDRDLVSLQITAWISGYITHVNRTTPNTYDVSPILLARDIGTIVARICDQNPEEVIEPILLSVLDVLRPASLNGLSDIIQLKNEISSVEIRQEGLKKVQEALLQAGYLEGEKADGVYGPRTATALSDFQQKNGIAATGLPDAVTIFVLFNSLN